MSKEPIIIDQPEDDLDTKNITDFIVKGINEKKQSQQIIVVTHNPNIIVNDKFRTSDSRSLRVEK